MYAKVVKRKEKRSPGFYYKEYSPSIGPYDIDGFRKVNWEEHCPAPREPKWKYNIILAKSTRVDGRVKTEQKHIATIGYYDIVDGFVDNMLFYGLKRHYNQDDPNFNTILDLLDRKLSTVTDAVINDYKQTDEYMSVVFWKERKISVQKEINRMDREESKKRQEQAKQRQEYQKRYEEASENLFGKKEKFTKEEQEIGKQIINEGYRKLAKKYHPDSPEGDAEVFIKVGIVKEKFREML